jgi:hypothetical protein
MNIFAALNPLKGKKEREVNICTSRMLKIKEKAGKHHKRSKGTVRTD